MKPLSADEYRAVLKRLGMNHREAGVALGLSDQTSRRYAHGVGRGSAVPERSVRLLYRLLVDRERSRTG